MNVVDRFCFYLEQRGVSESVVFRIWEGLHILIGIGLFLLFCWFAKG